jgi:hypothetical protein
MAARESDRRPRRRERESLAELRRSVREAFPEPEFSELIDLYLNELSFLMDPPPADGASDALARHQATSSATGDDAVTLLYKLEDFLESILVGRFARRSGGGA